MEFVVKENYNDKKSHFGDIYFCDVGGIDMVIKIVPQWKHKHTNEKIVVNMIGTEYKIGLLRECAFTYNDLINHIKLYNEYSQNSVNDFSKLEELKNVVDKYNKEISENENVVHDNLSLLSKYLTNRSKDIETTGNADIIISEKFDGTLFDLKNANQSLFNDKNIMKSLVIQLVEALYYLGSKKIVIGDVRQRNILYKKVDKGELCKLDGVSFSNGGYLFGIIDYGQSFINTKDANINYYMNLSYQDIENMGEKTKIISTNYDLLDFIIHHLDDDTKIKYMLLIDAFTVFVIISNIYDDEMFIKLCDELADEIVTKIFNLKIIKKVPAFDIVKIRQFVYKNFIFRE